MVSEHLAKPPAQGKKPRLMFQDEARFGRMSRPRRCWAPAGTRPVMQNGYEREFTYVYGAVSPLEGDFDHLLCDKMNTEQMGGFLQQVSDQYPDDYILMIVDGASSHKAKALAVPANLAPSPCPAIHRNSIRKKTCGMKFARKTSRTASMRAWKPCASNSPQDWRPSPIHLPLSPPSPPGLGFV